jgi:hypothetical protein
MVRPGETLVATYLNINDCQIAAKIENEAQYDVALKIDPDFIEFYALKI